MAPKPAQRILIVDDDQLTRQMAVRALERHGYTISEAGDGIEALEQFQKHYPHVILMDAMMPRMDGITACEKLQQLPDGPETPVIMITALDDPATVDRAFDAGATDYITKPLNWAVLTRRVDRLLRTIEAESDLQERLAQLDILRRIDRELGYTLDLNRVLNMATDSALRWSGAMAVGVIWLESETEELVMLKELGKPQSMTEPVPLGQIQKSDTLIGDVFREKKNVQRIHEGEQSADLAFPLRVRGEVNGCIVLEKFSSQILDDASTYEFLEQLADRTAAAIDKGRTYDQTQRNATQIDILYNISTNISGNLDVNNIYDLLTRGCAELVGATSAFFCTYDDRALSLTVVSRFVSDHYSEHNLKDKPPVEQTTFKVASVRSLYAGPIQYVDGHADTGSTSNWLMLITADRNTRSNLLVPVIYEDTIMGVVVVNNTRSARIYRSDDINLVRSLATQGATALQQARLFQNIQELEQIKTEMIRMASHDLRNPMGQITGYFELLVDDIAVHMNTRHERYVARIAKAIGTIDAMLEDILNLENIENQTTSNFAPINIAGLMVEVVENLKDQAHQKTQRLTFTTPSAATTVRGSTSQLRQVFANLIGNAIKYTPAEGAIIVTYAEKDDQFHFAVQDTGYGIPADQQDQLFKRFFRAKSAATESIEGTGLGLSLVKSVVERHDGEVWFKSIENEGSTFGFRLPLYVEDETN